MQLAAHTAAAERQYHCTLHAFERHTTPAILILSFLGFAWYVYMQSLQISEKLAIASPNIIYDVLLVHLIHLTRRDALCIVHYHK